jgi:hypothetical protein
MISESQNLKPTVSIKKLCPRNNLKHSIYETNYSSITESKYKNIDSNKSLPKSQSPRTQSPRTQSPRIQSSKKLVPIQVQTVKNNNNIGMLKVDKDLIIETEQMTSTSIINSGYNKLIKETYDDDNIFINKNNNIDVKVKVINQNDNLVKELKYYAEKINDCKIFDNFSLEELNKIKKQTENLKNETTDLKLNYQSLMSFTESMDELLEYFTLLDKQITKVYNIDDEKILTDLLNAFKKIYTLINIFNKLKLNIDINTQINIKLSTHELNSILNSVTVKIMHINDKIIKFMNNVSNKEINEILEFLNCDDSEEINFAISDTLKTLNENLEKFDNASELLQKSLGQLKEKIKSIKL